MTFYQKRSKKGTFYRLLPMEIRRTSKSVMFHDVCHEQMVPTDRWPIQNATNSSFHKNETMTIPKMMERAHLKEEHTVIIPNVQTFYGIPVYRYTTSPRPDLIVGSWPRILGLFVQVEVLHDRPKNPHMASSPRQTLMSSPAAGGGKLSSDKQHMWGKTLRSPVRWLFAHPLC